MTAILSRPQCVKGVGGHGDWLIAMMTWETFFQKITAPANCFLPCLALIVHLPECLCAFKIPYSSNKIPYPPPPPPLYILYNIVLKSFIVENNSGGGYTRVRDFENTFLCDATVKSVDPECSYNFKFIFQCIRNIFCAEYQRFPLKSPTKYLRHTPKVVIVYFIQVWTFKSTLVWENSSVFFCLFVCFYKSPQNSTGAYEIWHGSFRFDAS